MIGKCSNGAALQERSNRTIQPCLRSTAPKIQARLLIDLTFKLTLTLKRDFAECLSSFIERGFFAG